MHETTRRLRDPVLQENGNLVAHSFTSSVTYTVRGAVYVGSRNVIPVIFIPGMMGSNLRLKQAAALPQDYPVRPGASAWRPPNNDADAWLYARAWAQRAPAERQLILNPQVVEVDNTGRLDIAPCYVEPEVMRERGWGEIHAGSYGQLLYDLQSHLESTFRTDALKQRHVRQRWKDVMSAMQGETRQRWGVRDIEPLTEAELELYAQYQYPVYAFGYNWLQSSGESAARLEKRVTEIIEWWGARKHQCDKVILVTHSMGGFVARACAKRIPDKIAGVVHGVMPAVGAPLAYRRLACGTEADSPENGGYDNFKARRFADLGGRRPEDTTPVLAVSPGALELLPTQLHPRPWLHVRVLRGKGPTGPTSTNFDYLHLPNESAPNPYDLYRDMDSWYRLINPALADPAKLYPASAGGVTSQVLTAIAVAEKFHLELADYYHPATFAFYGDDREQLAYSQIRWLAKAPLSVENMSLTGSNVQDAKYLAQAPGGARTVEVEGRFVLTFAIEGQDARGDGTVPHQSANQAQGRVKQLFATRGYQHQQTYLQRDTLLLTRYCIVKLVQGVVKNDLRK